jgi:hypothetical protein
MRPFEAGGSSKPLGLWTTEEIGVLAEAEPRDATGDGWLRVLHRELVHFGCERVADLSWQEVVAYGMQLGCFDDEADGYEYVRSMLS